MSTQRGNVKKSRPQKYQNKAAFKNVYHDTSKKTHQIVNTDVSGVCSRCKDCIDWKIRYKKYKPLTQPKTCVTCKQKTIRQAYLVYCTKCSADSNKCAKCGEKKNIVKQPKLSEAEQASEDRELQFELEQLPERKRRTFLRLQDKGLLTGSSDKHQDDDYSGDDSDDGDIDDTDEDDGNILENNIDSLDCHIQNAPADGFVDNENGNKSDLLATSEDSLTNQVLEISANKTSCIKQEEKELSDLNLNDDI